jgi:hypothetical protein
LFIVLSEYNSNGSGGRTYYIRGGPDDNANGFGNITVWRGS